MTLIEALAAGRPVVATRVGGVEDVVHDGVTGHLVRPGDTHAIAERLALLAADPELRRRMGETGRAQMLQRYAVSRLVDDVDRLYRTLLATASDTTTAGSAPNAISRSPSRSTYSRPRAPISSRSMHACDGVADRAGDEHGAARRDDEAAADLAHDAHRLGSSSADDQHRPPGGQDPVEAARDDKPARPRASPT